MVNDVLVDDPAGSLTHHHIHDRAHIRRPASREELVRPAQRMRRHDDILQGEQRVIRGRGLRVDDVEPCPGNPSFLQHPSLKFPLIVAG